MGGTFDPVHKAHFRLAAAAAKFAGLDKVIFLPALRAPLRDVPNSAPPADRVNMLKLALRDFPYPFEIELCEIENPDLAYSIDTANFLLKKHAGARLNWIIGDDHLQKLKNWKDAGLLCAKVGFICAPRQNGLFDLPPELSPLPDPEEILAARLSERSHTGACGVKKPADDALRAADASGNSANGVRNSAGGENPAGNARNFSAADANSANDNGGSKCNARSFPAADCDSPAPAAVNPEGGGNRQNRACNKLKSIGRRAAAIAKIARSLNALEVPQNARIEFIPFKKMPHSATMIRAMLSKCGGEKCARELDCMLDFRVFSYIKSNQLYGIAEGAIPHSKAQNDKP